MLKLFPDWPAWRTLRVRLTLWYIFLLGLTLCLFSGYLYFRLQESLLNQLDTALQVAATQALANIDPQTEDLTFQTTPPPQQLTRRVREAEFAMRFVAPDGTIEAGFGRFSSVPIWVPTESGFMTLSDHDEYWRIYSQPIRSADNQIIVWLQTAQSLDSLEDTLDNLKRQIILAVPLVLLIAGGGGLFLANRALRPIDQITRTAQTISAGALARRIDYRGPADEVGRLASTLDQMLDRLQAAFAREQRFTADASHELRTPLTALKGRIGVTLSQRRTPAEHERTLQDLEKEVDRLIRLSNDLLFLARLDQGSLHPQTETVDLSNLLDVIVEQVHPLAQSKELSLIREIPADLSIQGNSDRLIRLFLNLLDNAIKYTQSGGQVTVQAKNGEATVNVTISDTGPGIPVDHLPHLFEPFYRVEAARSRSHGGVGLGLTIAHEITRAHGGVLEVWSQFGQGTTFTVLLPAQVPGTISSPRK